MRKIAFAAATAIAIASSPAYAEGWTGAYVNAGVSGSASSADVTTEFDGALSWTVDRLYPVGLAATAATPPTASGTAPDFTIPAVQQVFDGVLSGTGKANNRFRAGAIIEAGYDYEVGSNFVLGLNGSYNFSGNAVSERLTNVGETDAWTMTQQSGTVAFKATDATKAAEYVAALPKLGDSNVLNLSALTFTGAKDGDSKTVPPVLVESGTAGSVTQFTIGDNWSIGARAGVAASPNLLVFATAGYTQAEVGLTTQAVFFGQNRATTPDTIENVGQTAAIADSKWKDGYYLGGGVEAKLTNNISIKAEYRFADYGSYTIGGIDNVKVGKPDQVPNTGATQANPNGNLSERDLFDLTVPVNYSVTADNIRTHALRVTLGYRF